MTRRTRWHFLAAVCAVSACVPPADNQAQTAPGARQPAAAQPAPGTPQPAAGLPAQLQPSAATPGFTATGTPRLSRDPSGRSPMLVPQGWTVNVRAQGQRTLLRIDESPGVADSPMLGLVSQPLASGATPDQMLREIAGSVVNPRVLLTRELGPGVGFVLLEGVLDGIPAKMAAVGAGDATFAYVAFFAAPSARFEALGGSSLLLASMGMGASAATPAPATPGGNPAVGNQPVDVASYEGQVSMLQSRTRVRPALIVGTWSQGTGVPTGNVYESATTGAISYGSIGHGNLFEFKADGTYAYVHNYAQLITGCRSTIQSSETGRYEFDGLTLVLRPAQYQADVCACCRGNSAKKQSGNPPARTYEVAIHPAGRHMVIRGTCPEYIISCVGEPKYMREGFTK